MAFYIEKQVDLSVDDDQPNGEVLVEQRPFKYTDIPYFQSNYQLATMDSSCEALVDGAGQTYVEQLVSDKSALRAVQPRNESDKQHIFNGSNKTGHHVGTESKPQPPAQPPPTVQDLGMSAYRKHTATEDIIPFAEDGFNSIGINSHSKSTFDSQTGQKFQESTDTNDGQMATADACTLRNHANSGGNENYPDYKIAFTSDITKLHIKKLHTSQVNVDGQNKQGSSGASSGWRCFGGKKFAAGKRETTDDFNGNRFKIKKKSKNDHMGTRIKEKKTYTDIDIDDDEIEGKRNYSIDEKLKSHRYNKKYVKLLKGEEFTLKYIQEHGLESPIVFHEKAGLGLRVPSENFHVSDVKQCVGSRRIVDVMDVTTQKALEMTMREWVQYFENLDRERLLNVISLEFSHTKLENYVESPNLVRQIDWVDTVWPPHYKECQTESTNIIEKMKYPKVQKYCLMSVAGCYTDFHIDFGGTSVWYHILHGEKVFWLIPPTEKNVDMYVNWVLSGKQGDVFLGDHVEGCQRIELHAGYTFIIPSGWIHAVFTPKDSLVFGGNFIHSFNIINQLRVCEVEDKTHVPQKFRYPFYAETAWYVLARYVACVVGKSYVELPPEDKENDDKSHLSLYDDHEGSRSPSQYSVESFALETKRSSSKDESRPNTPKLSKSVTIELTRIDDTALKKSNDEENVPRKRGSPRKISSDSCSSADTVIYDKPSDFEDSPRQENEKEEKAGKRKPKTESESNLIPVSKERKCFHLTECEMKGLQRLIAWLEDLPPSKKGVPKDLVDADAVLKEAKQMLEDHKGDNPELACSGEQILIWPPSKKKIKPRIKHGGHGSKPKSAQKGSPSSSIRRRRTRCKKCEPCTRNDCGECNYCKDMKKFGGPGRMKQSCISRQCLAPVLPHTALCMICGDDTRVKDETTEEMVSTLMECGICWEIVHPPCLSQKFENLDNEGNINEDLPNSWECPKCCHDGKQGQLKPRIFKGCSMKKFGEGQLSSSNESLLDAVKPKSPKSPETPGKRVISKQSSEEKDVEPVKVEPVKEEPEEKEVEPKMEDPPTVIENGASHKQGSHGKLKTLPKAQSRRSSLSPRKHLQSIMNRKKNKSPLKSKSPVKSPEKKKRLSLPANLSPESGSPPPVPMATDPVVTRSGRTVKRSPQLTDENVESDIPRKRPRREGTATSPDGAGIHGNRGDIDEGSPSLRLRNRVQSPSESRPSTSKNLKKAGFSKKSLNFSRSRSATTIRKNLQGHARKKFKKKAVYRGGGGGPRKLSPEKGSVAEGQQEQLSPSKRQKQKHTKSKQEFVKGKGTSSPVDLDREGQGPSNSNILPKEPMVVLERYVVRPGPATPPPEHFKLRSGANHCLNRELWIKIFSYLNSPDLARCLAVCKVWNWWAYHPSLWKIIDLSEERIVQAHLIGIVRRQPRTLNLNSVVMTQHQLLWLSARLPQLKHLSLVSCSWATVSALCFSTCPLLHSLDLSWMLCLTENHFHDLLTPPTDRRPGMKAVSRLHRLKTLAVTGTEMTDNAIQTMVLHLNQLEVLDISYCTNITDQGIKYLSDTDGSLQNTLKYLNISGCKNLSDEAVKSLVNCSALKTVNIGRCSGISEYIIKHYPNKSVKFIR